MLIFTTIFLTVLFGFGVYSLYYIWKDSKAPEYKEYKIKQRSFPITFEYKHKTVDFRKLPIKNVKNKDVTFIVFDYDFSKRN